MRKWVVLALGAVLALAGLMSIWQGSDIVQIERGWTAVIAGAVTLSGGIVTIALFFVICAIEDLQAAGGVERPARVDDSDRDAETRPSTVEEPPVLSPPATEAGAAASAAAPALTAIPEPIHIEPEPAPEPKAEEPVFAPPPPPPPMPSPVRHEPTLQEPEAPAREPSSPARRGFGSLSGPSIAGGLAAGAGAFGLARGFRFRRASESAPPPVLPEPPPPAPEIPEPRPHNAEDTLRAIEAAMLESAPGHEPGSVESPAEPAIDQVRIDETETIGTIAEAASSGPEEASSFEGQSESPVAEPAASSPGEPQRTSANDLDWLEKALSGEEETDPALDWLRNRADAEKAAGQQAAQEAHAGEPVVTEPAHQEPEATLAHVEPEAAHAPAAEEGEHHDPVFAADHFGHEEAGHPDTAESHDEHGGHDMHVEPAHETAHRYEEQPPLAEATVIGRYSTGGAHYTLYSDGSIDAETPQGTFRFESMADLRAHIEAQNAEG